MQIRPERFYSLRRERSHARRRPSSPIHNLLRAHGAQPPGRQPGARNRKLRPAAIQAYPDIRGRRHRWMAQSAGTVAIKPDFRRNQRKRTGLALRTNHAYTSATGTTSKPNTSKWEKLHSNPSSRLSSRKSVSETYNEPRILQKFKKWF